MLRDLYTRKEYDLLPEGFPAELIEGALVREAAPTYGHNSVSSRIRAQLVALVGPDRVPDSPSDVAIDDFNVFQPDIVVLDAPVDPDSSYVGVPRLAVDVLSPSTRHRDRSIKAERLLEVGVKEIWLVDPATKTVEVRTEGARRFARGAETAASAAVKRFALVPEALFAPPR